MSRYLIELGWGTQTLHVLSQGGLGICELNYSSVCALPAYNTQLPIGALMQLTVFCPGQHWLSREDGAHYQDLTYSSQPLGLVL